MKKGIIQDYFTFSRKERLGILLVLLLILICVIVPFIYPFFIKEKKYDTSTFEKEIAALKRASSDSNISHNYYKKNHNNYNAEENYSNSAPGELFEFDPNAASAEDWKRLGLRDKTITTLLKYISKGGHFYKPEDISKIWGLNQEDAERLMPYVRIKSNKKTYSGYDTSARKAFIKKEFPPVDINAADTTALINLPGIGPSFARRIYNFRNRLGGFYSVDQIAETFGLPDSTFQKIRPKIILGNPDLRKVKINTATIDELKTHPYIRFYLAKAFVNYRDQHGAFKSVADLKKIMILTDSIYNKLSPYISIE